MNSAPATQPQSHEHSLDQTPPGRWALITRMETNNGKLHRLMAMGVCTGRQIKLVQAGNPLIIRVMNTRIGMSRELAKCILVRTFDHQQKHARTEFAARASEGD
jgi:Fe2+ transport system protein FeoA